MMESPTPFCSGSWAGPAQSVVSGNRCFDVLELGAPPLADAPQLRQPDGAASGDQGPGGVPVEKAVLRSVKR